MKVGREEPLLLIRCIGFCAAKSDGASDTSVIPVNNSKFGYYNEKIDK
jgi:hypothetical protein